MLRNGTACLIVGGVGGGPTVVAALRVVSRSNHLALEQEPGKKKGNLTYHVLAASGSWQDKPVNLVFLLC